MLEKENELKQQTIDRLETRNEEEYRPLIELTSKVGNIKQRQLADKLIEGKKIMESVSDDPQAESTDTKRSFLSRVFAK